MKSCRCLTPGSHGPAAAQTLHWSSVMTNSCCCSTNTTCCFESSNVLLWCCSPLSTPPVCCVWNMFTQQLTVAASHLPSHLLWSSFTAQCCHLLDPLTNYMQEHLQTSGFSIQLMFICALWVHISLFWSISIIFRSSFHLLMFHHMTCLRTFLSLTHGQNMITLSFMSTYRTCCFFVCLFV